MPMFLDPSFGPLDTSITAQGGNAEYIAYKAVRLVGNIFRISAI